MVRFETFEATIGKISTTREADFDRGPFPALSGTC